jgi:tRNA1Val (adenine37-N6)-methyltransferase
MTQINQTTQDYFLGKRLCIKQPAHGYRAGIDAILLGSAAAQFKFENICEMGCGVGTAFLTMLARHFDNGHNIKSALGLEIDEQAFELAKENILFNGFEKIGKVENLNALIPNSPYENKYDLVFSNPPYFDDNNKIRNPHENRQTAYVIGAPLENWIKAMLRLCHSKGEILLIHRADRLYDILNALQKRAGNIRVLPIYPKSRDNANRILIAAKKASRAPIQILPPIILRDSDDDAQYFAQFDEFCKGGQLNELAGLVK